LLYVPEIFQAPLATAANALEYRRVSRVSVSPAHNALKWPEISGGEIRFLGRIFAKYSFLQSTTDANVH
jgi:hypothetical protein